jgi:hypothetical protein
MTNNQITEIIQLTVMTTDYFFLELPDPKHFLRYGNQPIDKQNSSISET